MNDDEYKILPDIYWGDKISIASLFFSSKKIVLAIPPEGICAIDVMLVEHFSYGGSIEYKDGYYEKHIINPRELLGLNDSVVNKMKKEKDIITLEWNLSDFYQRDTDTFGFRESFSTDRILKTGPHLEGTNVENHHKKYFVALYNWAYLLKSELFDYNKCVFEFYPNQKEKTFDQINEILNNSLTIEAIKLSIPDLDLLSIDEALDIRNEFKPLFNPFWRTIERIRFDIISLFMHENKIDTTLINEVCKLSIQANLGTTLQSWSEELNNHLLKIDSLKKTKKFSKIFIDVLTGILKKDLSKLFETLIEVPEEIKTPSKCKERDYDDTIKFLYRLRKRNRNNLKK